jgi:hypothetical protein
VAKGSKRNLAGEKPTAYIHVNALNGEAFHLATIARLLSENKTVIGVEGQVNIQFYKSHPTTKKSSPFGKTLKRRIDIISGTLDSATWWEVKSLGYNRKNQTGKINIGVSSGLTTLDLKILSSPFKKKKDGKLVILDDGNLKVKSGQFYSKEFFVDRVFAGADPEAIPNKMQWVLHSFEKKKMNTFVMVNKSPSVHEDTFFQCGVNKPEGGCKDVYVGSKNPLDATREKLVSSIRTPNLLEVKDVIFRTFSDDGDDGDFSEPSEVSDYINDFKKLAPQIIDSKKAGSWIVQPLNAVCEINNE